MSQTSATTLPWLLGLRRDDINVAHRTITVAQTVHALEDGNFVIESPKTRASRRTIFFPASIAADIDDHLRRFVAKDRGALIFTGEKGGPLRQSVLYPAFRKARNVAGHPELTLHDLRHTADTLAAATGATLPELMHRMGHATPHSALRYLHATRDRDRVISEALAELRPDADVIDLEDRRKSYRHAVGTKRRRSLKNPAAPTGFEPVSPP